MKKSTDPYYIVKDKIYSVQSKFCVLYSHKLDFFFLSLLLVLSIIFFKDILTTDGILVHGDHIYALTIDEHIFHHLSNLPVHASKLLLLLILYPLKVVFGDTGAEKVFTMMTLFLAASFVYLANKQMVSKFGDTKGYWQSASCFVGSLVFVYNPWTIDKIHHHYWLVISLAASYLLIALIDSYLRSNERNNVKRLMLMAFSTSVVASQPHSPIIYLLPMLVIYLIVNLFFHRSLILSKSTIKKISVLVIIIIACNVFWLVPAIQALITTNGISAENVSYGLVEENVELLSRRATIQNVLQGTGAWLLGGDSSPDQSITIGRYVNSVLVNNNIDLWGGLLAFLPLLLIFLFFSIRRPIGKSIIYIVVFFSVLLIFSVILATGSHYNDVYTKIFLGTSLGELMRDPYKFSGLYFVAVSFFASMSLYRLDRKNLKKNMTITLLMIALIFSWGWVGLTGNLNGHLTESILPYPNDLSDVSEYLHDQYAINSNANGKIFWYPSESGNLLQYSSVPELSTGSLPDLELPRFQLNYINYLLDKNDTSAIPLLEYLGVQYLVIREDYVDIDDNNNITPEALERMQTLEEVQGRVQNLRAMLYKNNVFEAGRFEVYKLNADSQLSVSQTIAAGTDDLSEVARVAGESEYLNNIQLGPFLEDSLIISGLLPPESSESAMTIVDPKSDHHSPEEYWSAGAINGGWMNSITSNLNRFGINTWQFDYNNGFIFTWGDRYTAARFSLENAQTVTRFDFNSANEILQWENSHPESQSLELEQQAMLGQPGEGEAMRVVLNSSTPGWKTIKSPAIDISSDRVYLIKLGLQYFNAQDVQLRITEYDKNDVIINEAVVQNFRNGSTYQWRDISFSYRPSTEEVASIGLSIWHGNLTKQPLPNFLWIDSVGIYDVSDQVQENSISVPFKVNSSNNFKVFVRYLESPEGGLVTATLEDSLIEMNTLASDSKLVWKELGEYTINQGSHTMTFNNERGFNAINAILLIEKNQFEEIKGRIEDWFNRSSSLFIPIFEAEPDMNINDRTIADTIRSDSDDVVLENGTVWKQFDVRKEGDYRIWIKGYGKFILGINDHRQVVNATMDKPSLSEPFRLNEGGSRLEVTPLQELRKLQTNEFQNTHLPDDTSGSGGSEVTNIIDSVWLVANSNHLHELFDKNDDNNNDSLNQMQLRTTISDKGWSSQQYEINLNNITKPFMISLAEPFDPNLRAVIYTKDGLSKTENPIPLFYSLKTGIYIDSLNTDAKVVIYDSGIRLEWLVAVSSFISLASYAVLILSANVKLTNGFKGLAFNLSRHMKERISQNRGSNS
ncbi:MAG: hypothetical protein M3297_11485 [Thermoproteota archaeon]|nr:hypothetical protein [Thermoproteota archaeon]